MNLKIRRTLAASASLLATAGLALAQSQAPCPAFAYAPSMDARSVAPAITAAKAGDAERARAYMASSRTPPRATSPSGI